ncbi:hypothetical protein ACWED2_12145 [Amycolatopsis sp. NPDC005003]
MIESPRHDWDFATGTEAEVTDVLTAWQHRLHALRPAAAQVVVFRNHGLAAGISRQHPHSQVAGLPVLSAGTRRELETARTHHRDHGRRLAEEQRARDPRSHPAAAIPGSGVLPRTHPRYLPSVPPHAGPGQGQQLDQ